MSVLTEAAISSANRTKRVTEALLATMAAGRAILIVGPGYPQARGVAILSLGTEACAIGKGCAAVGVARGGHVGTGGAVAVGTIGGVY